MADQEQLEALKQGADVWNSWLTDNFDKLLERASLCKVGIDLTNADLRNQDLAGAHLSGANLMCSDLRGVNFRDASLLHADLNTSDLRDAILTDSDMQVANLRASSLDNASLARARLTAVDFSYAALKNADFADAQLGGTEFVSCDLTGATGLDTCSHSSPNPIDHATLQKSGMLPNPFLRGCGLPESYIEFLPSLLGNAIEFCSCFISYSRADKNFARRLHDQLQGHGIRCWLDEHQMLPGDDIHKGIQEGIKLWDKVLLCCSEASLTSWWVDNEIETAFAKERKLMKKRGGKVLSLIPLNLDDYMFTEDWDSGKKEQVHSRIAADFTGWEHENEKFEEQFEQVVKALRTDDARPPPPEPKL